MLNLPAAVVHISLLSFGCQLLCDYSQTLCHANPHQASLQNRGSGILGFGSTAYVAALGDDTVLKYPNEEGDAALLADPALEARVLQAVGEHAHICRLVEVRADGFLVLERASNGTVFEHVKEHPGVGLGQRLRWVAQAASALAFAHAAGMLHCDICPQNMLLDGDLDVKVCDFSGPVTVDGETLQSNAFGRAKYELPRADTGVVSRATDIFALGVAAYWVAHGHEPFPELDDWEDEDEYNSRFTAHAFPQIAFGPLREILYKCWSGSYKSMGEVAAAFEALLLREVPAKLDSEQGIEIQEAREQAKIAEWKARDAARAASGGKEDGTKPASGGAASPKPSIQLT